MKEGWSNCKIGDICSITDFVSNGSFASLKENVKYYNSPNYAVLVRLADASNGFDKSKFVYTDEHGYDFSKKSHLHGGELIMSNVGSVGSMFICPVMKQPMTLAPNTISITSQNNTFLYYYFLSDEFKAKLKGITSSTTLKKFNKTNFKLLEICIPSLSEQQSIVDYLDYAFAKIDAMKANAEKALGEAKALFQASLKEMLEPKEGWEEKKLGDVGTFIRGGNFSKKDFVEDGYPCIHYGQIHTKFGVATFEHLSCVPETMVKKERCASKGDLVIAITSEDDEGSCKCTAWMADYDAYVGGHTAIFKHNLNPIYVSYYFKAARFQKDKLDYTHGFKVVEISPKDIAKIPICYPSAEEQQSIVDTLDSLKSKVDRLQANYEKISQECDALKQAILRQVFE